MARTEVRGGQIADNTVKLDTPNQDVTGVLPVANGGTGAATQTLNNVLLGNGTGAFQNIAPGSSGNVLKSDGTTWASAPGGGDVSSNTATSVDAEVVLFNSTTGKSIKRATGSGIAKLTSGVLSVVTAPSGAIVGTTDAQSLTNKTFDSTSPTAFFYPGFMMPYGGRTAPSGWLMCDGSNVSRTTYANLFAAICEAIGTVTTTIATPAVLTFTAHGLVTGDQVYLTTTGALPTGLAANTLYYAIRIDANTFNLATSRANAYAGTKIATSGTQSGVHTLRWCPFGLGDGSTTFTLPDFRGRTLAGSDAMGLTAAGRLTLADPLGSYGNIGSAGGEQRHTMTTGELVAHAHNVRTADNGYTIAYNGAASGAGNGMGRNAGTADVIITQNTGSTTPFNLISPTGVANIIIKT